MNDNDKDVNTGRDKLPSPGEGRKESLYDKIPLTKKQLDVIIIILMAALIFFIVLGALIGNGII